MRKIIVILSLLVVVLFGCSPGLTVSQLGRTGVFIDHTHTWANNCPINKFLSYGKCRTSWRSIRVRVINRTDTDMMTTVRCFVVPDKTRSKGKSELVSVYDDNRMEFGRKSKLVKAYDDNAIFLIWGFARTVPDPEIVECEIDKQEPML